MAGESPKIYTVLLNDYEYTCLQEILEKVGELGIFDHLTENGTFDLMCNAVDEARSETLDEDTPMFDGLVKSTKQ